MQAVLGSCLQGPTGYKADKEAQRKRDAGRAGGTGSCCLHGFSVQGSMQGFCTLGSLFQACILSSTALQYS